VNDPLRTVLLTLLTLLGSLAALLVVVLVVVRSTGELRERLARRRRDELRHLILTALLADPQESLRAQQVLAGREGRAWRQVEQQAFAMLPKIKGDSHGTLVSLLLSRGAAARAHDNARARSLVRQSRGAYQLGALGDPHAVPTLLDLLRSRHFLVRRTAVRALGQVGDPLAVRPLLDAVSGDPALVRDVVAALQRIGPGAVPDLRRDLESLLGSERGGRRGPLVVTVLGLHGDLGSVSVLVSALDETRDPALRSAAAEALGAIGARAAVPVLVSALRGSESAVRIQAAVALGRIGDCSAVPALAQALGGGGHEASRALAGALVRLGGDGLAALEAHASPYAAEALAVHRMRVPA
jgi:hypothetical protein